MSSKKKSKKNTTKKKTDVSKEPLLSAGEESAKTDEQTGQEEAEQTAEPKDVSEVTEQEEAIEPVRSENQESVSDISVEQKENAFLKWCSSVVTGFRGMQKGIRNCIIALSLIGIVFGVTVIVLAVHLDKAKDEIKSVQAVSLSLQEELNTVKSEQDEIELQLFGIETAFSDAVLMKEPEPTPVPTNTPTPVPTSTPTPTPEPPKYVVCVDAGHGGKDGGAVLRVDGVNKRVEKKDNLRMAKWFRDALQEYGIQVVMTRDDDTFLELSERTDIANEANADVLISFHRNSFAGNSTVGGVEFWIHSSRPEQTRLLAQGMLDAITDVGGMDDRGVKYGRIDNTKENYSINQKAKMPSMIVELGFISNEEDNAAYDTYGEQYANEMAKVVYEWLEETVERE